MKTLLCLIPLLALLAAGCTTPISPQQMTAAATFASYTGASIDLLKNTNHCANYKAVTMQLDALDAAGNYDAGAFTFALQGLPIKQLNDPRARLIIGETVILWDIYSGQIVGTNQAVFVKPVLQGTDSGLKRAMIDSGCK